MTQVGGLQLSRPQQLPRKSPRTLRSHLSSIGSEFVLPGGSSPLPPPLPLHSYPTLYFLEKNRPSPRAFHCLIYNSPRPWLSTLKAQGKLESSSKTTPFLGARSPIPPPSWGLLCNWPTPTHQPHLSFQYPSLPWSFIETSFQQEWRRVAARPCRASNPLPWKDQTPSWWPAQRTLSDLSFLDLFLLTASSLGLLSCLLPLCLPSVCSLHALSLDELFGPLTSTAFCLYPHLLPSAWGTLSGLGSTFQGRLPP